MEFPEQVTSTRQNGTPDPLTVGEAVDAYQALMNLDPSALGETLTNEVMDAVGALEPVVEDYKRKMQAHQRRLADGEGEEVPEDELEQALSNLREETTDVQVTINHSAAPSIRHLQSLRAIDALKPLL